MQVFLSYANSDRELARDLTSRLSEEGYRVWNDEQFLPGDNVLLALGKALERSDAMVVLLSPASVESKSVRWEIEYALGSERYAQRLIPVLVQDSPKIPWILRKLPLIKVDKNWKQASERVIEALKQVQSATHHKPRRARAR